MNENQVRRPIYILSSSFNRQAPIWEGTTVLSIKPRYGIPGHSFQKLPKFLAPLSITRIRGTFDNQIMGVIPSASQRTVPSIYSILIQTILLFPPAPPSSN